MACKCNEVTSLIMCMSCGHKQTINHDRKESRLVAAKREGKVCANCGSIMFKLP